jgi:hypothetical protein
MLCSLESVTSHENHVLARPLCRETSWTSMSEQAWYVVWQPGHLASFSFSSLFSFVMLQQFGGATVGRNSDMLFIEKKEVAQLLKIVRSQC